MGSLFCWLRTTYKALLYDHKATLSLGRLLIVLSFLTGLAATALFAVLIAFIVLTAQMEAGAPLVTAIAGIYVAMFGSATVAQIGLYFIQQKSGGGASVEQIQEPGPQAPCDVPDANFPGGI